MAENRKKTTSRVSMLQKLGFNLLFKVLRDELQLSVVLEHLAGDIEAEVG